MATPDLEIKIKTQADLEELKKLQKELEAAKEQASRFGLETGEIEAHLQRVNQALAGEAAAAVKLAESLQKTIERTRA